MYNIMDNQKIIEQSTKLTIDALEQMYKNVSLETNKTFYKTITKYYSAMSIIINKIKTTEENNDKKILLDNILLNFCSLIHCVVLKDIKLINFIYRNIVERVIRYIADNLTTRDLDSLFRILTTYSSVASSGSDLVRKYGGQLKDVYTKNCLYVHTDISKIPTNLVNLNDYQNTNYTDELLGLEHDFILLNVAIINLFKVLHKDLYLSLAINASIYIDAVTPLASRTEYQAFLHDCKKII